MTDDEVLELVRLADVLRSHRWPWAPLAEALGGGSLAAQAARLGVHDAQVHRWRRDGLTDAMADRCAVRAGLHPAMVWPDWNDVADAELKEVA